MTRRIHTPVPCPAEANAVVDRLDRDGLAFVRDIASQDAFDQLCRTLGEILLTTQIRIDEAMLREQAERRVRGNRPSTYQAEALDFHTDNPVAHFLAWHCLRQDPDGGTLYLLDTGDIAEHFSQEELDLLASIHIEHSNMPPPGEPEKMLRRPLVSRMGNRHHIHYQRWLLLDDYTPAQRSALDRFQAYLGRLEANHRTGIRLEHGESLFIDNHRLLHGRGPLPPNSRRHLVRHFICC